MLDWGLGHATRSIPVIREFQRQGAEVFLASSGPAGQLLRIEFPTLCYHELPGYNPKYSSGSMMLAMTRQLGKFMNTVRSEHAEVAAIVKEFRIDAIISENRYGCYFPGLPCIMISHQPVVRLQTGFFLVERMLNAFLRPYLYKYKELWMPDQPGSGLTDRFISPNLPVRYVGWLSRFTNLGDQPDTFSLMAVVSGPEPQRGIFAEKLRQQMRGWPGKSLLVTGQPERNTIVQDGNLEIVSHLPAAQLEARMRGAALVIARGGYSTIMDLIALGKRAAFVPTPGQPEQHYLARLLEESGVAYCQDQENFDLKTLVEQSGSYVGFGPDGPQIFREKSNGLLEEAIKQLLS